MSRSFFHGFVFFVFVLFCNILTHIILERSTASVLKENCLTSQSFRQQDFSPELYQQINSLQNPSLNLSDVFTTTMLHGNFHPQTLSCDNRPFLLYKKDRYLQIKKYYEAIWKDLQYFPVAVKNINEINYENSWMEERAYGGQRHHEGTDLFGNISIAGYYPVISITDGTVEQKGWLPLGGYRIGIRSASGGYFYYAHLSSYGKTFFPGETVHAGDIIGFMGNTGYGKEGTSGKFPVHLHVGIYITSPEGQEISVNPYQILQCLRKKIRKYSYC